MMISSIRIRGKLARYFRTAALFALVAFFAYTLTNKLIALDSFKINIAKTSLFRGIQVDLVAYFALLVEASAIALLLFKERLGLYVSLAMMLLFTAYILVLNFLGMYEVCGCGGILNGLSFAWHFCINVFILLVILFLLRKR